MATLAQPSAVTSTRAPRMNHCADPYSYADSFPDRYFESDHPGASLSKPPTWMPPAPHGPSWSRFRRLDSTGRPREVRLATCAVRLGSPSRGAHSAGESRARGGWRAGILRIGRVSAMVPLRTCPAARSRLLCGMGESARGASGRTDRKSRPGGASERDGRRRGHGRWVVVLGVSHAARSTRARAC
jgi:hypothetical protein